ncbi:MULTISPECIES: hypothetical protein [Pseudomonas]|jgi:hypothetical protein|uniref:Prophage PssSM-02 n=1 Tax=Pseudomonas juntendi TaxID=2666183 RepID=A0AAJ5V1F0_9PSED|nr:MULTISPECIES: hypothetical protein [Pseudomonas]AVD86233.1 hypothetical protein C4Q26_03335 [Pseudomonas sp. SWI44]MCO6690415.1 hypothetical protein [Pseudomonas shirazica]USS54190.1 hypothetical protein NG836_20585 [Pseudomonas kermanshahensis]WEA19099.1 hypothetical protein PWA60_17580 [Pseudomonas juntendi]
MRSPHVLIDEELDAMAHPGTDLSWSVMVQKLLTEMLADQRITIEEFNHYCGRLNKIVDGRKEVA